jgi:tetraacyldisaccharide 4'-kinase
MRPPRFWRHDGALAALLSPLGCLYALGGAARLKYGASFEANVPTICVGNLTLGGAGKTPVVREIASILAANGRHVAILSRGHGGSAQGPLRVDPATHDAATVGDEPLLLATAAPVYVAKDRAAGARAALADGADCLLLDDGFQSPALKKTFSIVVVDGGAGLGNGRVFPAGPLREPPAWGLSRATAVVMIGADTTGFVARHARGKTLLHAALAPVSRDLAGAKVFAFAGIGRPEKFFSSLRDLGCTLAQTREFADHHPYTRGEIEAILRDAAQAGAKPVTTEKDLVRIPPDLRAAIATLNVRLAPADVSAFAALVREAAR